MKFINWLFRVYKESDRLKMLLSLVVCVHVGVAFGWYFVWLTNLFPVPCR